MKMKRSIFADIMKTLVLFMIFQGCLSSAADEDGQYPVNWKDDVLNSRSAFDPLALLYDEGDDLQTESRADFTEQFKRVVQPDIPTLSTSEQGACSCGSQYVVRDLGDGHYPRFITVSRCKPRSCRNNQQSCRLLRYMLHVLRLRRSTELLQSRYIDSLLTEIPLPEPFRNKWQLQRMSVAVACIPDHSASRS